MDKVKTPRNPALSQLSHNPLFWKNKKVLVTGHTGFKGGWLSIWLNMLGAEVLGYALTPPTQPSLFERASIASRMHSVIGNINCLSDLSKTVADFQPDIIFHLAAQALVRPSYANPVETYETNVMGTVHLLEAARHCANTKVVQIITSDKCYKNSETGTPLSEDTPFGGKDPYSSSKGCAELVTEAYRDSFFSNAGSVSFSSVRAGNVIGGGDWAVDRLIPDCLRHIAQNTMIPLRNPAATRPWQFVLEPLSGYLWLAQQQWSTGKQYSDGFNFGPNAESITTVEEVTQKFLAAYGDGAYCIQADQQQLSEAKVLSLDITKAEAQLAWYPVYTIDQAIEETALWYKNCQQIPPEAVYAFCQAQISAYVRSAKEKKLLWALDMLCASSIDK
jgi:CDP-glucose 4,6-dehydratase